jgi:hypothetical protein
LSRRSLLLVAIACLSLWSCADSPANRPTSPGTNTTRPVATPTAGRTAPSVGPTEALQFPVNRTLAAGPATLVVRYGSSIPVSDWRAASQEPLRLAASGYNPRKRDQKMYLKRVTVTVTPLLDGEAVDADVVLSDTSELNPGYYFRAPNNYTQTFAIPALNSAPDELRISVSYEVLLEIDGSSRDYSKQSGEDTLTIPLANG